MKRGRNRQLDLAFPMRGGKREGSGRKATGKFGRDAKGRARAGVRHRLRPWNGARVPMHVTVRAITGAPSLRSFAVAAEIGSVLKRRAGRTAFRSLRPAPQCRSMAQQRTGAPPQPGDQP